MELWKEVMMVSKRSNVNEVKLCKLHCYVLLARHQVRPSLIVMNTINQNMRRKIGHNIIPP